MNVKRIVILLLCLLMIVPCRAFDGMKVQPGEELTYEVSYMGIKLGTICISTGKLSDCNGSQCYLTEAKIATYKSIPFVKMNVYYRSYTDKSVNASHRFYGLYKSKDYIDTHKIFFNYQKRNIYVSKSNKDNMYFEKSFSNPHQKKYADGLSLFFVARNFLNCGKKITIPTIIDKDTAKTDINFSGEKRGVKASAVKYPVATRHFTGIAHWTGVYGLTGFFEGFFSDDEARIPIRAKLQLYLGSVEVELIKYTRKGWTPPKYSD